MKVWAMWIWMADDTYDFEIYSTKEKAEAEAVSFISGLSGTNIKHYGPEELTPEGRDVQCWSFDDAYGTGNRVFVEEREVN